MLTEEVKVAHADERGEIRNIAPNVAVITCKAGSIRSNHLHKTGWHWLYVVSGRMLYIERQGKTTKAASVTAGHRVFTGPRVPHRTEFPEDTVLVSYGPTSNDTDHDSDTVGVDW